MIFKMCGNTFILYYNSIYFHFKIKSIILQTPKFNVPKVVGSNYSE